MSSLEQEVRTLQKQVRRQRRWNIGLGALVIVGGLMAATAEQSVPDVIQAKKFEVVNDEGKAVVTLEVFQGGGVINSCDKKGNMMFLVLDEIGKDGVSRGTVHTRNGKGQTLVELGATREGEGMVETQNGKGQTLVEIGTTTGGSGSVTTKNGKGVLLVRITTDRSGNGAVAAQDASGNIKATLP